MIRRSLLVAALALTLSLLIHGLGLTVTSRDLSAASGGAEALPVSDVGGGFEDFAEPVSEPEPPETAQPPETPEVTPPDVPPTSLALVASETPQFVTTPDTGTAQVVAPTRAEEVEDAQSAPETAEAAEASEAAETVAPETGIAEADAVPDGQSDPVEAQDAPPAATAEDASPADLPVTPEAAEPDIVIAALPDAPEIIAADEAEADTNAAVTRSLRPPRERPSAEALGVPDQTQQRRAASGVIESPLTAFKSRGVDLIGGSRSGASGFSGARAAGNASATNYAGQVLLRLNRAPVVFASARGAARVSFQIDPDGSIAWIRILSSTGTNDIDRAARAQVQSAAPFPRPPSGTSQRFVFNYRNR